MKLWQLWSHDRCPKCDDVKDGWYHILRCNGKEGRKRWEASMSKLTAELDEIETDPWISKFLPEIITKWRDFPDPYTFNTGSTSHPVFHEQSMIGWGNLVTGQIAPGWREIQNRYIKAHNTKIDLERWTHAFVRKLWQVAWDVWDYRNHILHESITKQHERENTQLIYQIKREIETGLPTQGLHHFRGVVSLEKLQKLPTCAKQQWLESVRIFRLNTTNNTNANRNTTPERSSRGIMQRWLHS